MSTVLTVLSVVLPLAVLTVSVMIGVKTMKTTGNAKHALHKHFATLIAGVLLCAVFTVTAAAAGADEAETAAVTEGEAVDSEQTEAAGSGAGLATGLGFIGAALSIGLAGIGGGLALSAGAPAAIGAVAEDPKSFGKSMIFVALGEAVAIYGLIIAFLIVLKIPNLPTL